MPTDDKRTQPSARRIIRWFIEEFSTIAVLVAGAVIVVANQFGKLSSLSGPALVAILVALSFLVVQIRYKLSSVEEDVEDVEKSVERKSDEVRQDFGSLRGLLESDRLHEAEMCDRTGFYRHMLGALRSAGKSVDLTQLDSHAPKHYGTPEMVEYFNLQTRMVREYPGMKFRRIVAIPTLEKLEWVLDVLDDVKDCPNFQINVINLATDGSLPPPLSLQIFDRREMCLVDPTLGYMLPEDQRHMLWVKGGAVSDVFSIYYDSLWGLAQRVKEGSITYWPLLTNIHKEIAARHPEKGPLAEKIRARIVAMSGSEAV